VSVRSARRATNAGVLLPWWARPSRLGPGLLVLVLVIGTTGYVLIEGWSISDALYMTVTSITTVGYREVHDLSPAGRIFTMILLLGGVGTVFYVLTLMVAGVVEGGLFVRLDQRRRARMIDNLHDHFIVCGYGRVGRLIVEEFRREGVSHVVIDRDPDLAHEIIQEGGLAVSADASSEEVLQRVGIHRARGLVTAVSTDAENVYIVLSARLLRPDLYIIGRAETDDAVRKLKRAGADRVISPYQIGAQQMALTALRPAVVDFVQLATTTTEHLDLAIEQVKIGNEAPFAGQSIVDANLRQRFGVVIVGIQRTDGRMEFNPAPDAVMQAGDQLVVMGRSDGLKRLESMAHGAARASDSGT
jgi:voltage-gated potassium channel